MAIELFAALILGASTGLLLQRLGVRWNLRQAATLLLNSIVLALVLVAGVEAGSQIRVTTVDLRSILYYSITPGSAGITVYALYRRIRD